LPAKKTVGIGDDEMEQSIQGEQVDESPQKQKYL
jgi:hypothetical protein